MFCYIRFRSSSFRPSNTQSSFSHRLLCQQAEQRMPGTFAVERKPHVLVIDQDRRAADSLAFALEVSGFRATAVYTYQKAGELAAREAFQFVVSDAMSEGMQRIDALLAICDALPNCRLLLMPGNHDCLLLAERAQAQGCCFEAFAKPAHPKSVVEKLRELLLTQQV